MAGEYNARILGRSIVTAACILVFVPIAYFTIQEWRARRALETFAGEIAASVREADRKAAIAAYQAKPAAPKPVRLETDEVCMQGTVVRVLRTPTKGYEQVLERGRPVRCAGRQRL
jgi:hypothetical protein